MQRFYHFLGDNRAYVTLGLAVLISLSLMLMGTSERLVFTRGITSGFLELGHRLFAWPIDLSGLRYENQVLKEQNLRLSLELLKLREARLENARLRELLEFRAEAEGVGTYLPAKVVARDPDRIANTILIDAGYTDGVRERMPVVTAEGLVGRILEVHPWTAIIQLLLDRNCRVSAIVQRVGRTQGIVMCENGVFYLKNVQIRSEIEVDDPVISSGLGEVFPKGILVGRVKSLGEGDRGLFREVILTPGVQFDNLEEVFVLKQISSRGPN